MTNLIQQIKMRMKFFSFTLMRLSSMVLGLVANIIIIRKLTVEDFGVFSIALLVVNLITTFGFSWSSSSIIYFGSKEKELHGSLNKTFWSRNIIIIISLFIVTIGIILFRENINTYIGINIWFLLLLWLYVSVIENYLNHYFLAVKKQLTSSLLSITAKIIYISLILIFSFDIKTLIVFYIVSHASVIFYILGINRAHINKFEFDKNWFKQVLNFSLWQLFGFAGVYLLNFGDTAVVKFFMTNRDVGLYNAAYQLFNATASFSYVITSYYAASMSQSFANGNKEKVKKFFYKERIIVLSISTLGHLVVIMLSKQLITTFYGLEYEAAVPIFNILMIGSILKYITVFYILYYNTNNKHHIQQIINIIVAIVNILLSIVMIKRYGLLGPAYATTITLSLALLFSVFYCEKRLKTFVKIGSIEK